MSLHSLDQPKVQSWGQWRGSLSLCSVGSLWPLNWSGRERTMFPPSRCFSRLMRPFVDNSRSIPVQTVRVWCRFVSTLVLVSSSDHRRPFELLSSHQSSWTRQSLHARLRISSLWTLAWLCFSKFVVDPTSFLGESENGELLGRTELWLDVRRVRSSSSMWTWVPSCPRAVGIAMPRGSRPFIVMRSSVCCWCVAVFANRLNISSSLCRFSSHQIKRRWSSVVEE